MCTVDDDIDILWETDMLPTPLKTVYMFYLNWQTFIQTSIMCNVNILPINYIATSLVYTTSNFAYPPTTSTDTLKLKLQCILIIILKADPKKTFNNACSIATNNNNKFMFFVWF